MNLQEIRKAVLSGQVVCWNDVNYRVVRSRRDEYMIVDTSKGTFMQMTISDGEVLSHSENRFFIKPDSENRLSEYIEDLATDVDSVATSLHPKMIHDRTLEDARKTLRDIADTMRKAADRER